MKLAHRAASAPLVAWLVLGATIAQLAVIAAPGDNWSLESPWWPAVLVVLAVAVVLGSKRAWGAVLTLSVLSFVFLLLGTVAPWDGVTTAVLLLQALQLGALLALWRHFMPRLPL